MSSTAVLTVLVLGLAAACVVSADKWADGALWAPQRVATKDEASVKYTGTLLPEATSDTYQPLHAGMEARYRVTMSVESSVSAWRGARFNASAGNVRVRIIPAYPSRGTSGLKVTCPAHTDFWQEFWGMSSLSYGWGSRMVTYGFMTFTVPPFPFRVCLQAAASYRNETRLHNNVSGIIYNSGTPKQYNLVNGRGHMPWGQTIAYKEMPWVVINTTYTTHGMPDTYTGNWIELSNMGHKVEMVNASAVYTWASASDMYAGDWAVIKIVQNGYRHNSHIVTSSTRMGYGDILKLVPAGLPCTYEKWNLRSFCGHGRVDSRGHLPEECAKEGSIQHGVAYLGTNKLSPYNNLASTTYTVLNLQDLQSSDLVAYVNLPAAGKYDVCFSAKEVRKAFQGNRTSFEGFSGTDGWNVPVFTKIFQQDSTCTSSGVTAFKAACRPATRLTVAAASSGALRWSTPHSYPGSWGAIRVYHPSGTATQTTAKATSWEWSTTREFYTTVGGDQFRLVDNARFTSTAITYGNMYMDSNGNVHKGPGTSQHTASASGAVQKFTSYQTIESTGSSYSTYGASGDQVSVRAIGTPDQGSMYALTSATTGGCWNYYDDNYGNANAALNGASTSLTQCCTPSSGACTASSTGCTMTDTDHEGVTSSADLGNDPRVHRWGWTYSSSTKTSEAWAFIRFPVSRKWRLCYRLVGTQNWRTITRASDSSSIFDSQVYTTLNYTYHANDTQAQTWGPITVKTHKSAQTTTGPFTTQNLNYVGSATVVGSAVKIVKHTESCYTATAQTETHNEKPGLKECEVGACSGSASCANCMGSADDSATARWEITFYVRMPSQLSSNYYRVCFKHASQNWMQISDPSYVQHSLMTSPHKFNTRLAPNVDVLLKDWRENTWGKFLVRRSSNLNTLAFNIDANNAMGMGDVFRLVPNRTTADVAAHCDVTWGATSTNGAEFVLQNFDPNKASWNLGVYCLSTSSTSTSICYTGLTQPTDSVSAYVGTYPYLDLDSNANGRMISDFATQGAVAFITIPPTLVTATSNAGYRMCYKPRNANWIETMKTSYLGAPNPFVVAKKPTHVASVHGSVSSTIYAGQYGYIKIAGDTVNLDTDLIKLVLSSSGNCERPAAGTGTPGNMYASFSWRKLSGSTWTEAGYGGQAYVANSAPTTAQATLGSRGTSTTGARAYMTFPTISGITATTTTYKICYMTRSLGSSDAENWQYMGTVNVYSPGVAYTAENQPYNNGVLGLRFVTGGTARLNTLRRWGDAAKVVAVTSPCMGPEWGTSSGTERPNGVASNHVGQEVTATEMGASSSNTTLLELGNDDLGDTDLPSAPFSRMEITLPWVSSMARTYYKVCYRLRGMPWMEVIQAPLANQAYALGSDQLRTFNHGLSTYTITAPIIGVAPFTGATYSSSLAYTNALVGGAATASIGTTNTSYFKVTYTAEFTSYATDQFKLVKYANEVVRGVYENIPNVNCRSPGVLTVAPGPGTSAVSGAATVPSFSVNLPTTGGRYLLCYKKTGLSVWLKLEPDSAATTAKLTNPFHVIPNTLSFSYVSSTGNFTVSDLYQDVYNSNNVPLGAVSSLDKIYIVNASDHCGLSHGFAYDPTNAGSQGSINSTLVNAPKNLYGSSNVSQTAALTVPTAANWYKLCYQRTSTTTMQTASGATTPQPYTPANWYQVENLGASSNGGGTPFFVTSRASKLKIDACPMYNASRPLRTGLPVDITVKILDTNSMVLPFSVGTWAYLVTATGTGFTMENSQGSCLASRAPAYGWDMYNLRQWADQGMVKFSLAITTGCPAGGCVISFEASDGILAPGGTDAVKEPSKCTLVVQTTTINDLSIWSGPTTCMLDQTCNVRVAAFWTDRGLAHTATDDVMVSASNIGGLSLKVNKVSISSASSVKAGSFASGYFLAACVFDVTNGATFTADQTVTITFTANSKNATHNIKVLRQVVTKFYIVDLYPVDQAVETFPDADKHIRTSMVPSWEPSVTQKYFGGMLRSAEGHSMITAASGYHLVAQQAYAVILRPVDANGKYINKVALLGPTNPSITITNTDSTFSSNKIMKLCSSKEVCDTAFSAVTMTSVTQKVSFRLKNGAGCTKASPCGLSFQVNSVEFARITTPVRSVATKMVVTCWQNTATTESALGTGTSGSCPSSTVEKGVVLKVEAQDADGKTDEFFDGKLIPILMNPGQAMLTTVARLSTGKSHSVPAANFTSGFAWIWGLTLSKPCASKCDVQLLTDWGAGLNNIGSLVLTPSTQKLNCALTSQLYACVINTDGNCETVSGYFSYDSTTADNNKVSLIYKDTKICTSVSAVNSDNALTHYETNWVMYYAQALAVTGTTVNAVTLKDTGASPTRVKAMVRSAVSFCFTVDAGTKAKANFRVRFSAQRFNDNNYWSTVSSNGECSLGTFSYFSTKHIARIEVTKVADPMSAINTLPSSAAQIYGQRADAATTALGTTLTFGLRDHYNNVLAISDLYSTLTGHTVVVSACSLDSSGTSLATTCTASTTDTSTNILMGTPSATNQKEGGVVTATLTSSAIVVNAEVVYAFTFSRWCLGCSLTFQTRTTTGTYTTFYGGVANYNPAATVTLYIVIHSAIEARILAFRVGTSPWSYWQKFDTTSTSPSSSTGSVVLFKSTCFSTDKSSCSPVESWFQPTMCDAQTSGTAHQIAASSSGTAIQMYVYSATTTTGATTTNVEPQCGSTANCNAEANVLGQVDILNSYTISVKIGNQVLKCSGTACTNDLTTEPSQTIAALGATPQDAAKAFAASPTFKSTSFVVSGVYPSAYHALTSGKLTNTVTPSYNGAFTATASSNQTGVKLPDAYTTTGYAFVFRGPKIAKSFNVLDTAVDTACLTHPTYKCVAASGTCGYDGYQKMDSVTNIAYKYAYVSGQTSSIVPIGVAVPISAEVRDANSKRVATAKGSVVVDLYSWTGCNNGGTLSVAGGSTVQLDNGRLTAWVSFSAPCENCVLRFTLTPDSTQSGLYTDLNINKGQLVQYSKPINIRSVLAGSAMYLNSPDVPADQKDALGLSDTVTVNMNPVRAIGQTTARLQVSDSSASGSVRVYNQVQTSGKNWAWFGNGGVLRADTTSALSTHHQVHKTFTNAASVSVSFMFTRTCPDGCTAVVTYSVNGFFGSFLVKNKAGTAFKVTAASSKYVLVGYRPRMVMHGTDFALAAWHMASGPGITHAGVGSTILKTATATKSVEDNVNGDGGEIVDTVFQTGTMSEIHRVRLTRSCNRLRVGLGTDSARMNVYTAATHLRVDRPLGAKMMYTYPMTEYASFGVFANDDLGFVDVRVGGYSGGSIACFSYDPMKCPSSFGSTISCSLSANGKTAGGFVPAGDNTFMAAPTDVSGTMLSTHRKIVDGKAADVRVTFDKGPVRSGYPIFKVGTLDSGVSGSRKVNPASMIDISVGKTGLNLAVRRSATTSISMFAALSIEVGLVKLIGDSTATNPTSFIALEADNMVKATPDPTTCPALAASSKPMMNLKKGYAVLSLVFAGPTAANTQCTVNVEAGAGSGVCSTAAACKTSFTITVTTITVTKWYWMAPSAVDNAPGMPAGPLFGAMGRTQTWRIGLMGSDGSGATVPVMNCDNPATEAVEQCTMTITPDTNGCTDQPTISAVTWNTTAGYAQATVQWPDVSAKTSYTCSLTVSVKDSASQELTIDGTIGSAVTVSVCRPVGITMVTNTTNVFRNMVLRTGVPYSFQVAITDSQGKHCRGDSGDQATELMASIVSGDRTPKPVTAITAYNTNMTNTAVMGWKAPMMHVGKAVAGYVTFTLWFSNSSVGLGIGSFRVRVTPYMGLSTTSGLMADSGPLDTVIAASMLRFTKKMPKYWVQGRQMPPASVQAVDALDMKMLPMAPNVARRSTELGNNLGVSWRVDPLPTTGFPLTFKTGAKDSMLKMGEAMFVATFSTSRDGPYDLIVRPTKESPIMATKPETVIFQTIKSIQMTTKQITQSAPDTCSSNCVMSNKTFAVVSANGTTFLNSTMLNGFNVSVIVADALNMPVMGEDKVSYLKVRMVKTLPVNTTSASTVALTTPPAFLDRSEAYYAPVKMGRAHFSLGFFGTTFDTTRKVHDDVHLEFSCPATVPASVAGTMTAYTNPCAAGLSTSASMATSMKVQVIDPSVPTSTFTTKAVRDALPIVKIPTKINSLTKFNMSDFKLQLATRMSKNFPYITGGNADAVIKLTACEVLRNLFGNSDLGTSVCVGGKCSGTNTQCPTGVVKCTCDASAKKALSALLGRYLLQTSSTEVQVEAKYDLAQAVGFSATSEEAIIAAYKAIGEETVTVVASPDMASAFSIDTTAVSTRTDTTPVVTQTPAPTPKPTPAPTPEPPATTAPPTTAAPTAAPSMGHSDVRVTVTTALLAALLMLLGLMW